MSYIILFPTPHTALFMDVVKYYFLGGGEGKGKKKTERRVVFCYEALSLVPTLRCRDVVAVLSGPIDRCLSITQTLVG